MMRTFVHRMAIASTVVMFLVLIQGTLVTTTGSADGCGDSWPLCHGEFIPQYTVATAIEYSHRLVVSIASFMIIATAIGALWYYRQRLEMRIYVPIMVVTLFLQAGLGAAAVMWPQADAVLALHFGVSLVSFASTLLVAVLMREMNGADRLRDRPIPQRMIWAIWGLAAYTYIVVYIGAYVRHSNASLACTDWPLCNGSVFPGFSGPVGVMFGHRVAALILTIAMGGLLYWTMKHRSSRPDLFIASAVGFVLLLAQGISGGLVVLTRLDVFATLSHGVIVSLFFGSLAYLCVHALPRPAAVRAGVPVPSREESFTAFPAASSTGD
jgi:cytochrome c oxidase assembly protein subunit 15